MMTHRERQLAAIRREVTDRPSVDAMWVYNAVAIAEHSGIAAEDVSDRLGFDGRMVLLGYEGEFGFDPNGTNPVRWSTIHFDGGMTGYSSTRTFALAHATSVADIEAFAWPDPDRFLYDTAVKMSRMWGDTYAVRGPLWVPLFCKACDLFGIEDTMIRMAMQPAVIEALFDRITDIYVEVCGRLLDACGDSMPIFYAGDDFATQRGLMFSPEMWRHFIKPRLARIFEVGKKRGKLVWFHSCGDISAVLPDLIDIGMDVWETVQLHTLPMPPQELKREYGGDIAFFGGINTQRLPFATPGEVREEVHSTIEILGEGGGYVCGGDHSINADVPPENALALYEAACAFRKEGCTLEGA